MTTRTRAMLLGATCLATCAATQAQAQTAAAAPAKGDVEEVIVTGFRRSLNESTMA